MSSAESDQSISPTSGIPPNLKSSDVESDSSKADTVSAEKSGSTVQPARHSWKGGLNTRWKQSTDSIDESQPKTTNGQADDTSNGEGNDNESSLPVTERTSRRASQAPDHPVELPASPISAHGNLRSFFDTDSESDEDGEVSPTVPVITRASSVRVQRPTVVQHRSADSTRLLHRLLGPTGPGHYPAQHSMSKAEQVLGHSFRSLSDMTLAANSGWPNTIEREILDNQNRDGDILQATPEPHHAEFDAFFTPRISSTPQAGNECLPDTSTIALAPTPPSSDLSFTPSSIIEVPSTPLRREALDTLPSPMGGFGTLRAPYMHPSRLGPSAVDGLRSNPLSPEELERVSKLHRTLSAPPLPSKIVKDMRRRVTIRPLDTTTANELSNGHRGMFGESIVSTPYPSRAICLEEPHIAGGLNSAKRANSVLSEVAEKPEDSPRAPQRDRFPSVITNEVLEISVSIDRHPLDIMLVKVPVEDRGTFDDEQLFKQLRASYYQLLGLPRRVLPRKISFVSCSTFRTSSSFSPRDFISHFANPKIGHKRKTWLLWLRSIQSAGLKNLQAERTTRAGSQTSGAHGSPDSQICDFTLQTTPKTALTVLKSPQKRDPKSATPVAKDPPGEGNFLASPSILTSPVHEKSISLSEHKPDENRGHSEAFDAVADVEKAPFQLLDLPTLSFRHTDSIPLILFGLTLTLLLSALAIIFWVLFGVPGKSAAHGNSHGGRREMGWRWQEDAQRRVGVGFIFGIFVLIAGLVVDGVWICIGRTLL